jgi:hypothetical protein
MNLASAANFQISLAAGSVAMAGLWNLNQIEIESVNGITFFSEHVQVFWYKSESYWQPGSILLAENDPRRLGLREVVSRPLSLRNNAR